MNTNQETLKRLEEKWWKIGQINDWLWVNYWRKFNPLQNNHRDNTDNPPDLDDQFLKSIKIDIPNFDGCHDPQFFINWTLQLDKYFTWYDLTEPKKVKFAVMKLASQASHNWLTSRTDV